MRERSRTHHALAGGQGRVPDVVHEAATVVVTVLGRVGLAKPTTGLWENHDTQMGAAKLNVLACMDFPREHRAKTHSAVPIDCVNDDIKRRTATVGTFANKTAITKPVGGLLLEQSAEWTTPRARCMTLETIVTVSETAPVSLPSMAS